MSSQSLLAPRRVGHVNLYVDDWLRSLDFYSRIVGLEEVFRESAIKAGFLSSGNTHHDIGFVQAHAGQRVGRDGFVQTRAGIGATRQFNHFGIEMESEKELVDAYYRLCAKGIAIEKLTDSAGLSKSIYVRDPDGNLLQFYADMTREWRRFWGQGERLITGKWIPEEGGEPSSTPLYTVDPLQFRAVHSAFQPLRVTGGTLVVSDLATSERYYVEVGGFKPVWRSCDRETVVLSARNINRDLTLMAKGPGREHGLRHFSFQMANLQDLVDGYARLPQFDVKTLACRDHGLCKSVYIDDPDGFVIEFYADITDDWPTWLAQNRPYDYPDGADWVPTTAA